MAISNTSTDYTGRKLDIYISGPLNPLIEGVQNVRYSFGYSVSIDPKVRTKYVAGVQKIIQQYLILLANSGFLANLLGSTNANTQEAGHIFNLYSWDVVQLFRAYQANNPNLPDDEVLSAVQLLAVTVVPERPDAVTFSAQLVTGAGDTVQFLMPLPLS